MYLRKQIDLPLYRNEECSPAWWNSLKMEQSPCCNGIISQPTITLQVWQVCSSQRALHPCTSAHWQSPLPLTSLENVSLQRHFSRCKSFVLSCIRILTQGQPGERCLYKDLPMGSTVYCNVLASVYGLIYTGGLECVTEVLALVYALLAWYRAPLLAYLFQLHLPLHLPKAAQESDASTFPPGKRWCNCNLQASLPELLVYCRALSVRAKHKH